MLKNNPTIQNSFVNNHINYQFSQNKEITPIPATPLYINKIRLYYHISSYRTNIHNTQKAGIWNAIGIEKFNRDSKRQCDEK